MGTHHFAHHILTRLLCTHHQQKLAGTLEWRAGCLCVVVAFVIVTAVYVSSVPKTRFSQNPCIDLQDTMFGSRAILKFCLEFFIYVQSTVEAAALFELTYAGLF